ncbi:hypothetical protein [Paraburkholderia sp. C35]|uniref:hypothetical protein n=1 Tax=Paraburkholderia sp. C35 TaxID=2126993 RepID=UPI000D68E0E5|nr:hypothetical protein [Paraburkholderia sp. C35]
MNQENAVELMIRERYEAWATALRVHHFEWLDENLASDYCFSARPYPNLRLNKEEFIEADKKMQSAEISIESVTAKQVGETIVSLTIANVAESFEGDMGAHMPSLEDINGLVGGSRIAYASAWRRTGDRWLCFDHHMIGPV